MKNKNLKNFYQKVYLKGEEKHYTDFVTKNKISSEPAEILKEVNWKNKRVLDVGCGTGFFAFHAAKKGAKVLGIDYAEEGINIAKKKYRHKNLKFEKLDVKEIKEKFDIIVSIGVLEHMDEPFKILKLLKSRLNPKGKIIITTPNWTNPRGYILMTLNLLFDAPITLADLHYLTPAEHIKWSKNLKMNLKWKTIEKSWAHGDDLILDFERRIPNVLKDAKLPNKKKNILKLLDWLKQDVITFENSLPNSGAVGLYVYSKK
jgi:2-polyprenyl-6-hydroxyphenyl methylase / 3-demethylubiquinone-9 3-methyltransferase